MSTREHGFWGVAAVEQAGLYGLRAPKEFSRADTPEQFCPDVPVDWDELTLAVEVDVLGKRVRGTATWSGTVRRAELSRVRFDADGFAVLRVFGGDGHAQAFEHDGRELWLYLGGACHRGDTVRVAIDFETVDPRAGFYFIVPDADHPDRPAHAWTQGQDEDSKYWFPCHDSPNHKVRLNLIATVPEGMAALSNGVLRNIYRAADADKRIYDWQMARPIPIYLLTLVVGPFVEVKQQQEPVPVSYFVLPGREADGERSFGRTPAMIADFERRTGVRYPFEKYAQVAVSEFVFGGMENASMTTQTDLTLHDERAHLDFSSEPLVSHELAHQWFGDLVTCRQWAHGWLNEGFATYFEQLWEETARGDDEFDYYRQLAMRRYMAEDSGRYRRTIVTHRYDEPIDVFDAHLYEKGGAVLHMLRRELGDSTFFGAVGTYLQTFADQVVETPDLRRAIENYAGRDLGQFFSQWVENGKGHPEFKVAGSWDADEKQFKLTIEQCHDTEHAPLFAVQVPVRFEFDGAAAVELTLKVSKKQHSFHLSLPAAPKLALVDPRSDLLGTWDLGLSEPLLRAALASAPTAMARVQAALALGKKPNRQNVEALSAVLGSNAPWMVQDEAARALAKIGSQAAFDCLAAAAHIAHPKARRTVRESLGRFATAASAELLAKLLTDGDPSVQVEAETARALGATRSPLAYDALVASLDRDSWNETVRIGVLDGLAALADPRGIAVAASYLPKHFPTLLRCGAIRCLCSFASEPGKATDALRPWTSDTSFRFAFNLAASLGGLGDGRALPLLQAVADRAIDGRVKKRANESIASIRAGQGAGKQVDALRTDVDGLRNQLRDLNDSVDRETHLRKASRA
ncbi:MAG: HEAT repeat domain-containing protein [Deltaproteobacteria bacterium]|nr:HEAT repeat domain-containing protein [Deltaproteobacteria bacterium]